MEAVKRSLDVTPLSDISEQVTDRLGGLALEQFCVLAPEGRCSRQRAPLGQLARHSMLMVPCSDTNMPAPGPLPGAEVRRATSLRRGIAPLVEW